MTSLSPFELEAAPAAFRALFEDKTVSSAITTLAGNTVPLVLVEDGLPDWWTARGNALYAPPDSELPRITAARPDDLPEEACLILGGITMPGEIMLWGRGSLVVLGFYTRLPASTIVCGGGSRIVVGDRTASTWAASLDSRNGGLIFVGDDGLWGGHVRINTDDMHAIRDAETGRRLNTFGGTVRIERHVWIAENVYVLGGSHIGEDCVIGARSVVKGELPAQSVCAGSPARVVRSGVTWNFEDLP